MKRIIVCDSGLGGLNVAARFFRDRKAESCELLYFNAYPAWGHGFNTLPSERAKEELFQRVLESMEKFSPDRCLVACNTLSIVYESLRRRYTPAFPVETILDAAVDGMAEALTREPDAALLILGTKTTASSGLYRDRLRDRGFAAERIRSLGCPGLATLLEADPAAPEVQNRIAGFAAQAAALFPVPPAKLLLALCCTHFEFASAFWREAFTALFRCPVTLVNPNERMGGALFARRFSYHARIGFQPGAREKMAAYFGSRVPEIASALAGAQPEPELFAWKEY